MATKKKAPTTAVEPRILHFPFPAMRMPTPPPQERRSKSRPQPVDMEVALLSSNQPDPLGAEDRVRRRVEQLSTTWYTIEKEVEGGVILRWGKELELWRKVDVPRKSYAVAISDYEVEFVARCSEDSLASLASLAAEAEAAAAAAEAAEAEEAI